MFSDLRSRISNQDKQNKRQPVFCLASQLIAGWRLRLIRLTRYLPGQAPKP
ncbi:hypothetical protein UYSO10_2143 [Kosakonia radicincitans]|nr:hypothetical protein UYSO10_2143 [Kosakonia radicincitans]